MRRNVLVIAALGATGVTLLFSAAASARPGARLTVTPPSVTTNTAATFKWKAGRGTLHLLCRLRWQPLLGGSAQGARAPRGLARKFKRCGSPTTWTGLGPGRYTFALIAVGRHARTRVGYRWRIVPPPSSKLPPPPPPPGAPPPPPPPPPGAATATSAPSAPGVPTAATSAPRASSATASGAAATSTAVRELRRPALQVPQARPAGDQRGRAAVRQPRQPGPAGAGAEAAGHQREAEPRCGQPLLLAGLVPPLRALAHRLRRDRSVAETR